MLRIKAVVMEGGVGSLGGRSGQALKGVGTGDFLGLGIGGKAPLGPFVICVCRGSLHSHIFCSCPFFMSMCPCSSPWSSHQLIQSVSPITFYYWLSPHHGVWELEDMGAICFHPNPIDSQHVIPREWPLGIPRSLVNLSSWREEWEECQRVGFLFIETTFEKVKKKSTFRTPLSHSPYLKESKYFICYLKMYSAVFSHLIVLLFSYEGKDCCQN